jgi:hypothetical protein
VDLDSCRVPKWLRGLWRRKSIAFPDGTRDTTTRVYWLQTPTLYADLRVPVDRPALTGLTCLAELTEEELLELARQQGFAGTMRAEGSACHWQRAIDFQPSRGVADSGHVRFEDGLLIEEGIHESYREVWKPIEAGEGHYLALRWGGPSIDGEPVRFLVAAGDFFIFARNRRIALPPAASLRDLIAERRPGRSELLAMLDFEISFGRRCGLARPWEIEVSTLPFREGQALDIDVDRLIVARAGAR